MRVKSGVSYKSGGPRTKSRFQRPKPLEGVRHHLGPPGGAGRGLEAVEATVVEGEPTGLASESRIVFIVVSFYMF